MSTIFEIKEFDQDATAIIFEIEPQHLTRAIQHYETAKQAVSLCIVGRNHLHHLTLMCKADTSKKERPLDILKFHLANDTLEVAREIDTQSAEISLKIDSQYLLNRVVEFKNMAHSDACTLTVTPNVGLSHLEACSSCSAGISTLTLSPNRITLSSNPFPSLVKTFALPVVEVSEPSTKRNRSNDYNGSASPAVEATPQSPTTTPPPVTSPSPSQLVVDQTTEPEQGEPITQPPVSTTTKPAAAAAGAGDGGPCSYNTITPHPDFIVGNLLMDARVPCVAAEQTPGPSQTEIIKLEIRNNSVNLLKSMVSCANAVRKLQRRIKVEVEQRQWSIKLWGLMPSAWVEILQMAQDTQGWLQLVCTFIDHMGEWFEEAATALSNSSRCPTASSHSSVQLAPSFVDEVVDAPEMVQGVPVSVCRHLSHVVNPTTGASSVKYTEDQVKRMRGAVNPMLTILPESLDGLEVLCNNATESIKSVAYPEGREIIIEELVSTVLKHSKELRTKLQSLVQVYTQVEVLQQINQTLNNKPST
ncbi:hypothetical protein Pelo_18220 [Pelomyxa schiedti]|nr:hypothetical protein Pelo_18220 [Pelomyxa schiedti]